MKVALTIAGSDSGGGAGIQADLKTFEAHGVFGVSSITAVTAQNTLGVAAISDIPIAVVRAQLEAVMGDFSIAAVKIGMLSSRAIIDVVADFLEQCASGIPVVLDPVMVSTSGSRLIREDALRALLDRLVPLATVVTPNVREAEAMAEMAIATTAGMRSAARRIARLGAEVVVVTGGDLWQGAAGGSLASAIDLLRIDGREFLLVADRISSGSTHGTGCTFSSAIAANLATGFEMFDAVVRAKDYVHYAIARAPGLGTGHGPMRHSYGNILE